MENLFQEQEVRLMCYVSLGQTRQKGLIENSNTKELGSLVDDGRILVEKLAEISRKI